MDGVMVDFEAGYQKLVQKRDEVDILRSKVEFTDEEWEQLRQVPDFYRHLPPMPDHRELWEFVLPHDPYILTGISKRVPESEGHKRLWVAEILGHAVPVFTCLSRDKHLYCQPGDIIIDDWDKYRHLWEAAGGIWILHTSAEQTITELLEMGIGL